MKVDYKLINIKTIVVAFKHTNTHTHRKKRENFKMKIIIGKLFK